MHSQRQLLSHFDISFEQWQSKGFKINGDPSVFQHLDHIQRLSIEHLESICEVTLHSVLVVNFLNEISFVAEL